MDDLLRHRGLVDQLEVARSLGFLGPGPVGSHIEHAGAFVRALADMQGLVVDLGSGGGVPGLVVGVARPDLALLLVDARSVRCRFLERAVEALALDAEIVEARAEDVGRSPVRGTAAAVMARSFGPPAVTAECGGPLLAVGGRLVVSEPPAPVPADRWPADGLERLGLRVGPVVRADGTGSVQVLVQEGRCPDTYPRRSGTPAKRPLF